MRTYHIYLSFISNGFHDKKRGTNRKSLVFHLIFLLVGKWRINSSFDFLSLNSITALRQKVFGVAEN